MQRGALDGSARVGHLTVTTSASATTSEERVRVLVADDHALVRAGLVLLLEADTSISVVAEVGRGDEAVRAARDLRPDVVLMDIRMPGMDGIEATEALLSSSSSDDRLTKVLILTTFDEDALVLRALRGGASGFLLKQAAPRDLTAAVHAVAAGEAWIDPKVAPVLLSRIRAETVAAPGATIAVLTAREQEVLVLMSGGQSNADISGLLFLSEATVKTHVSRILMKTGSRDRTQAVVLAYQSGLVRAGEART